MGFSNPPVPWRTLEQRLSGRGPDGRQHLQQLDADGSVSPAWTRVRLPYVPVQTPRDSEGGVRYAELQTASNFSFLYGASHPEALAQRAVELGLSALALTDRDGFYGVVRFAEAARAQGLPTIFGAEMSIVDSVSSGQVSYRLPIIAKNANGYAALARLITTGQLAGSKGAPRLTIDDVHAAATSDWLVLTGAHQGPLASAFRRAQSDGSLTNTLNQTMSMLVDVVGRDNLITQLWDHSLPLDGHRNDAFVKVSDTFGIECIASNNVTHARPADFALHNTVMAIANRSSLDEVDPWLPPAPAAYLRSGADQAYRFARYPGVVDRAAEIGLSCAFDLRLVAPKLPDFPVPPGHTEMSWLRVLVDHGGRRRYGPRDSTDPLVVKAWNQIDHELAIIEQLGFPGYFLVVWDLVEFCRREDIYCQGRGSAANSAVCFVIGVTKADAVRLGLLFERFLSPERDGPPDIDLDIESGRREEVIQYVYTRYGRTNAAQVANVITYRTRSAVRDVGRALGYSPGQLDAWGKELDGWSRVEQTASDQRESGAAHPIPADVLALAGQLEDAPRHLGIHSGGMVIADRPVSEVCPVEWGRMQGRSVLQWDKEDCAATGLVKFDLLGLGMLTMLHIAVDMIKANYGVDVDIAALPQEEAVYDMLCAADSVGVFQVESRAQMATLPRLKPRCFYDLVVEVALIRPGPIQGGSVHPYLRRRDGVEPVTYLHPLLERSLAKTLGVPLFQEQLMQIAIDVGGFSGAEADQLRQAMGSKRSQLRMQQLYQRFVDGARANGVDDDDVIAQIWDKMAAFANFGFPESHSVSFAYLVYSSSWCKLHYPAAFAAALLNAQPMGFWSPATILADARRHGVKVLGPDINKSDALARLQDGAVRVGLSYIRKVGGELALAIQHQREVSGDYVDLDDFARRINPPLDVLESLATSGAFDCFGLSRREALWSVGAVAQGAGPGHLPGIVVGSVAPQLPGMSFIQEVAADLWTTGVSPNAHPVEFVRPQLRANGVQSALDLRTIEHGQRVYVAGVVTHRQRPSTAQGVTFLNLEDETGLVNVVCSRGAWKRYRHAAQTSPAIIVRGRLERYSDVINIVADKIDPLPLATKGVASRDFR